MSASDPVAGHSPSPDALVVVAVGLAVVSGLVDAIVYLHVVPVFPANQSGNVVFLGLSIGGSSPAPGWAPLVAIGAFMVGAALGRWTSSRVGTRRSAAMLLGLELVLLTGLAVARLAAEEGAPFTSTATQAAMLGVAALAMGLQTDVIRSVAGVAVSTTYQSGAIARIGETIGMPRDDEGRKTERRLRIVLSVVLLAYVIGAALGATALGDGRTGLIAPAVLAAGLFAVAWSRPWS